MSTAECCISVISTGADRAVTNVYGRVLPVVMKLMRVIATAGRHIAATLVCVVTKLIGRLLDRDQRSELTVGNLMINNNNNNNNNKLFCGFVFQDLGRRISQVSGDSREASYLFQHIAVTTQHFNSVLFQDSFVAHESQDDSDA